MIPINHNIAQNRKKPTISVIVPVYNVEEYLRCCVDSILSQSFRDFELILVDDGSTDGSGLICDDYGVSDNRIRVFHQENKGVSAARNAGLNAMSGHYFSLIDADDYLDCKMLQKLLETAKKNEVQVASCGVVFVGEKEEELFRDGMEEGILIYREKIMKYLLDTPPRFTGSCCNKLFLSRFRSGLMFDEEVKMGEDWLFLCSFLSRCNRFAMVDDPLYFVCVRDGSSSRIDDATAALGFVFTGRYKAMKVLLKETRGIEKQIVRKYLDDCVRYIRDANEAIVSGRSTETRKSLANAKRFVFRVATKEFALRHVSLTDYFKFLVAMSNSTSKAK